MGGRNRAVHHSGLSLPGRRPAADQFPSAALDAVHAGLRLRRHRPHEGRLRACDRSGISLLLLWRRLSADTEPAAGERRLASGCRRAMGRRGQACWRPRTGVVPTPAFMPVGTAATVKALTPDMVAATGARMVLANTYHLMLRPGAERIARLGGLHAFMRWPRPILTDSGGYQVMSLAELRTIDEDGVEFRSHIDGSRHRLTPGARDRNPAPARRRHQHGARRVPAVRHRRSRRGDIDAPVDALGGPLPRGLRRRRRATACSASCRAACIPNCARSRRRR